MDSVADIQEMSFERWRRLNLPLGVYNLLDTHLVGLGLREKMELRGMPAPVLTFSRPLSGPFGGGAAQDAAQRPLMDCPQQHGLRLLHTEDAKMSCKSCLTR